MCKLVLALKVAVFPPPVWNYCHSPIKHYNLGAEISNPSLFMKCLVPNSHCTRISLEATLLERAFRDRPTVEGPCHDDALEGQSQVRRPQSTEDEDRNSSNVGVPGGHQPDLDDYFDRLMRARKSRKC